MAAYVNIDGLSATTDWTSHIHDTTYRLLGDSSLSNHAFTKILVEVPTALDPGDSSELTFAAYWGSGERMKTKFATSRMFKLALSPVNDETLIVYLDGSPVSRSINASNPRIITVDSGYSDGYLWVEYYPYNTDYSVGDTRSTFESDYGKLVRYTSLKVGASCTHRVRLAINQIQMFLGLPPSVWSGGTQNDFAGNAYGIMEGTTPTHVLHLDEMRTAIRGIETEIDSRTDFVIPKASFSSCGVTDVYMVQYLEEIMEAVNATEVLIISYL